MSNTKLKTVNIKGKEYVEVNERIKYFRSQPQYKNYSLESEIIELNAGTITIKAIIKDENGAIKATGLAQEKENNGYINKTSFVENCETSAWGRALGNLGIGIDTSIATAEEVQNAITNQEKKSVSKIQVKDDTPIYEQIAQCQTIEELTSLWTKEHKNVTDIDTFKNLCASRKAVLLENKGE